MRQQKQIGPQMYDRNLFDGDGWLQLFPAFHFQPIIKLLGVLWKLPNLPPLYRLPGFYLAVEHDAAVIGKHGV